MRNGASVAGRIQVVHVLDNLRTGGTELNAVRTAEHINRDRFDLRFLCLQPDGPLRARLENVGVPVTGVGVRGFLSLSAVKRGLEIRRLVQQQGTHIVHAHDPYANVLAVPWARMAGGVSTIASQRWWRDVHPPKVRFANRWAYRFAHRVLANSAAVGQLVVRDEGVPASRLVVIPNFVEASAFVPLDPARRQALRTRVGLAAEDVAVGIVARLDPVKDHAMLLRAAARVLASLPDVRFVLVGDGAQRQALTEQAAALGISDRVLMPGHVPHEPGLPGIFDVAVLTSREEGFPNFVVESMAASRAVVANDVGGVRDAVIHGSTGLLVRQGDAEATADALLKVLGDAAFREQLAVAASRHAREQFHIDVVLRKLESLYEELAHH